MQHAIYAPTIREYSDVKKLVALAQEAERAGYDGFFIWDVLFMERGVPAADSTVALAALALATKRIRLGAMVTPVARRRPWKLAKELATLDHLSGGRMVLGIGLGEPADLEYANVGDDATAKGRAERLDEGLSILDSLLRGKETNFTGKHHRLTNVMAVPACHQTPRVPIWVGASLPANAGIRRSTRWEGLFPISLPAEPVMREDGSFDTAQMWLSPEKFGEIVTRTLDLRNEERRDKTNSPFDLIASGNTSADAPTAVRDKLSGYAASGATWWFEWLDDRAGLYTMQPWNLYAGDRLVKRDARCSCTTSNRYSDA